MSVLPSIEEQIQARENARMLPQVGRRDDVVSTGDGPVKQYIRAEPFDPETVPPVKLVGTFGGMDVVADPSVPEGEIRIERSVASFDPEKVERWRDPCTLGNVFVVPASDYDHLLALYRELKALVRN